MRYVDGSAYPPPESVSSDGKLVTWLDAYVPSTGVTYTLDVQPLAAGLLATNGEATGVYSYGDKLASAFTFPVPYVMVEAPTPTGTPTASPTPIANLRPWPPDTPKAQSLYLPKTLRNE